MDRFKMAHFWKRIKWIATLYRHATVFDKKKPAYGITNGKVLTQNVASEVSGLLMQTDYREKCTFMGLKLE